MNETFVAGFFREFDGSCARMKQFFTEQLNKNDDLKERNEKLTLKINVRNERISVLEKDNSDLKKENERLSLELESRTKAFEELQKRLDANNNDYKNEISKMKEISNNYVGVLEGQNLFLSDLTKKLLLAESRLKGKTTACDEPKASSINSSADKGSDRDKILVFETQLEMKKKVYLLDKNAAVENSTRTRLKRKSTTDLSGNHRKRFAYLVNFRYSIDFRRMIYADDKLYRVIASE